jgi:phage portal protein BeeE
VLREISADRAATEHKLAFFERGAQLQTIVALDKDVPVDAFDEFVQRFRASHEGTSNAYGTLFVGGGADVTVTSADLQKLDYKAVQGGGETRIANAAGVHPVVVGLSEGLAGSSLNAGNYKAAMRNFADGTLTHLWTVTAASLQNLTTVPGGARLWIDKAQLPFLQDDAKDVAEIQQTIATAFRTLVDAGMKPDAAIEFLRSNDLGKLIGQHSGLFSVQLQPPGTTASVGQSTNGANGADQQAMAEAAKALAILGRG